LYFCDLYAKKVADFGLARNMTAGGGGLAAEVAPAGTLSSQSISMTSNVRRRVASIVHRCVMLLLGRIDSLLRP